MFFPEIDCSTEKENFREKQFKALSEKITGLESRFEREITALEDKTEGLVDFVSFPPSVPLVGFISRC